MRRQQVVENFLIRLAEGLTGFMIYESKCGMSPAYSEYFVYSPIVRISIKDWDIWGEKPIQVKKKKISNELGDYKRVDFFFSNRKNKRIQIAVEIKYTTLKNYKNMDLKKDKDKLKSLINLNIRRKTPYALRCFVVVVGMHSKNVQLKIDKSILNEKLQKIINASKKFVAGHRTYGVTVAEVF